MASGKWDLERIITHEFPLDKPEQAIRTAGDVDHVGSSVVKIKYLHDAMLQAGRLFCDNTAPLQTVVVPPYLVSIKITVLCHAGESFVSLAPAPFKSQTVLTQLLHISKSSPLQEFYTFRPILL